jgi:hypothetical protein
MIMPEALSLSRKVLKTLRVLVWAAGGAICALLVASVVEPEWFFRAIGVQQGEGARTVARGLQMIAALGVATIPLYVAILDRLLAMIDTVHTGDPFVIANARRLHQIAWSVVGLELIHLAIGAIIGVMGRSAVQHLDIEWSFTLSPWIAALLIFVLARVFEQGARMRAELEGTV